MLKATQGLGAHEVQPPASSAELLAGARRCGEALAATAPVITIALAWPG